MDMSQYLGMFIEEARDHIQSLNDNMLKLEENPEDLQIVNEIFRSAHTLKGMAQWDLSICKSLHMRWKMFLLLHAMAS